MKFAKAAFGSALLAGVLAIGLATPSLAQTNTNSGTKTPDMTDVDKKNRQMVPSKPASGSMSGATNTNSGTKTPDQQDVDKRNSASVPASRGSATTAGSGTSNNNSGNKTPDAEDVNKRVRSGQPPAGAPAAR